MIDCSRCVMRMTRCADCVIAVTGTRNVTGSLGPAELRALRVLADAGMVSPLAGVLASSSPGARSFPRPRRRDYSVAKPSLPGDRGMVME